MYILGCDQATHCAWCVMDDKYNIIKYGVEDFSKYTESDERNFHTKEMLNKLIDTYDISIVGLEDTFMQKFYNPKTKSTQDNVAVFRTLSKLLGVLECSLFEKQMCYITWKASEWRKACNYKFGAKREEQKANAVRFVNEKFNLQITDDNIAEAICIAYATTKKYNKSKK